MQLLVVLLLSFLAAGVAVIGFYSLLCDLILRDRSRIGDRLDDEFLHRKREQARKSILFRDLHRMEAEALADEPGFRTRVKTMIEQADMQITPQRLLTMAAMTGLGLGAIGALLARSLWAFGPVGALGAALPLLYVQMKRKARLDQLRGQLPDAFDLMARVLRAGQTMSQAVEAVTDELRQPIAGEFAFCSEQQKLGLSPEDALRDLARRSGLIEIKIFVLAVVVQRQTGGNLAELLDKLSHMVRERFRIKGLIRTLTAEGRFQGVLLLALPILLFGLLLLFNPSYAMVLFSYPKLLVGMFISEVIGALWIRKIVNFDF